jgi:hypothetical protein
MKKYVCVKDYVTSEGDVAFKQGKIYEITSNGMLYSELAGVKYYLTEQFKKVNFKKHKPVKSFGGKGLFDASTCTPSDYGLSIASQVNSRVNGTWTGDSTILKAEGKEVMRIDANGNIVDTVVRSVIKKFQDRSNVGIKKYGTTLDRKDIDFDGWAEHMQMELMDGILYLERLRNEERRNK